MVDATLVILTIQMLNWIPGILLWKAFCTVCKNHIYFMVIILQIANVFYKVVLSGMHYTHLLINLALSVDGKLDNYSSKDSTACMSVIGFGAD